MNGATIPRGREVPLTQEELGHLLGKSRQSIAKLLRLWEQDGIVQTKYGRVFIERPDALTRLAYPERVTGDNRHIAIEPPHDDSPTTTRNLHLGASRSKVSP